MADKSINFKEIRAMTDRILNGRDFLIGNVVDRLERVASVYPRDAAIKQMASALRRRFDKQGSVATISQREIGDMYDQVAAHGNSELFHDHLGDLVIEADHRIARRAAEEAAAQYKDQMSYTDEAPVAAHNPLDALFDNDNTGFNQAVSIAQKGVEVELEGMGYSGSISVAGKSVKHNMVIFAAELDTPLGRIPLIVPSEVKAGQALLPSYFVDGDNFSDFNAENMASYVNSFNGEIVSPEVVLAAIVGRVKSAGEETVVESALPIFGHSITTDSSYMDVAPTSYRDIKLEVPVSPEVKELTAGRLEEMMIEAGLSFGRDVVLRGKEIISTEIKTAGLRHDPIKVVSEFPGGFVLATHIIGRGGRKEIQVPVEVAGRSVLMPSSFTSGHVAKAFIATNLVAFASSDDSFFNPSLSDKFTMAYQDLYKSCIKNAAYGNFMDVEENLAIIQDKFGHEYHKAAFEDVMEVVKFAHTEVVYKKASTLDRYIELFSEGAKDREVSLRSSQTVKFFTME